MKKGLFFVGAICIAISSAALFTAFAEPTEKEKLDKAFNELKEKFMQEQRDACNKDAEAKALEKYEAEEAESKDGKNTNSGGGTTTKPTTKPTTSTNSGGNQTTTTTTTTTPTTTTDPKKDKMTNSTTTTTQDKKDKMSGTSTTTDKKNKMSGGK